MPKYLVLIAVLFWALSAWGEDEGSYEVDENTIIVYDASGNRGFEQLPVQECIKTEICGDAQTDPSVRCVRLTICGEPVR
jgi:hypothetical protein